MSTHTKRMVIMWTAILTYWTIKGSASPEPVIVDLTSFLLIPACILTYTFILTGGLRGE